MKQALTPASRLLLVIFLAASFTHVQAQNSSGQEAETGRAVLPTLVRTSTAEPPATGTPTLRIGGSEQLSPEDFFQRYGRRLGLGRQDEMIAHHQGTGLVTGGDYTRYRHYHRGIRVLGSEYLVFTDNGRVVEGKGQLVSNFSADVSRGLGPEQALKNARMAITARLIDRVSTLDWRKIHEMEMLWVPDDAVPGTDKYALVYSFRLYPTDETFSYRVNVDAQNGWIRLLRAEVWEAWVETPGTGTSTYDGDVGPFTVLMDTSSGTHVLQTGSIWTLSMSGTTPGEWAAIQPQLSLAKGIESDSSVFNSPGHANGVSVHYGTQQALDLFRNGLGIPLNNLPDIVNYVDVPITDGFAMYNDNRMYYGTNTCDVVTLDVVGHEMGHFLVDQIYSQFDSTIKGETGAILESFADIIGQLLEIRVNDSTDWISGGQMTCPEPIAKGKLRNFYNPPQNAVPQPDFFQGAHWKPTMPQTESNDYGNRHHNSSIQSKWFYLLSEGGSGTNTNGGIYDVMGVGTDTAISILLETVEGLTDTSQYSHARDKSMAAAVKVCGDYSQARISAHDAWRAVGLFQNPISPGPSSNPVDGESDVDPWPAVLTFPVPAQQSAYEWQVEIAEDFDFASGVQTMTTTSSGQSGMAEFYLHADRQYFWRVRPLNLPFGMDCWQPVRSFWTAVAKAKPLSPVIERTRGEPVHPWELEFSWEPHPTATTYTVEVSKYDDFSSLIARKAGITATEVVLDSLVDSIQHWRVRPEFIAPNDIEYLGSWSEAMFQTTLPAVKLSTPAQGKDVYPWPVNFEWKPVQGADHYLFVIKLARAGWGDPDGEEQLFKFDHPKTSHKLNLRGDDYVIAYNWQVQVVGPKIELLALQEEGHPGKGYFKARGSWTMPDPQTKGPYLCVPLSETVALEWPAVTEATNYHLQVFEALCPYEQSCYEGNELLSINVPAQPSSMQVFDFAPQPTGANDAIGFIWQVKSFGPEGIPGMDSGVTWPPVLLQPTRPINVVPDGLTETDPDDPLNLSWNSEKAHLGGFVVNVYKGAQSNCSGSPQLSFVHNGASLGQNNTVLSNLQPDSGTHNHSWKVRPFIGGLKDAQGQFHQSCTQPKWSDCGTFVVKKPTPVMTAPAVFDQLGGAIGSVLAIWSIVEGAEYYQVEVWKDAPPPGGLMLDVYQWNLAALSSFKNQLEQELQVDLSPMVNHHIAKIPLAIPLNRYFYQVKACLGQVCGPPSIWSEWWEFYPWPF